MNFKPDLSPLKQIPIIEVATRLGIQVRGTKAMCFMGHDKASPSLSFLIGRNTWRCFGACGKHGDGITLVMEKVGLDFNDALDWFAQNFGVNVTRRQQGHPQQRQKPRLKKALAPIRQEPEQSEFLSAPEIYDWLIQHCGEVSQPIGLNYLSSHGISVETANRFNIRELRNPARAFQRLLERWGAERVYGCGLAWGLNGRPERMIWGSYALLFPFYEENTITYIQARMFKGSLKFLNPRGIPKPMFNINTLKSLKSGQSVHLCEGVPDAVALESHGLAAVGILGATSFREEWVDRFLKFKVVILGDGDEAGAKFATDISSNFIKRSKLVQRMKLPTGKDVSDVLANAEGVK